MKKRIKSYLKLKCQSNVIAVNHTNTYLLVVHYYRIDQIDLWLLKDIHFLINNWELSVIFTIYYLDKRKNFRDMRAF